MAPLKNSKVILVGASYAASMVTWFRYHYPMHANGVWASSAPLVAKADFIEYKEVVGQAYKQVGSQKCYDKIQEGFAALEMLVAFNHVERIEKELKLCYRLDVSKKFDVWNMFNGLSNIMAAPVQNARPGEIEGVCDILTDDKHVDGIAALGAYIDIVYDGRCFSHVFDNDVSFYNNTDWNHVANYAFRQWIYQTCK